MKRHCSHKRNQALTLVELLVLVSILVVLAMLFSSALAQSERKAQRIQCLNNLKLIGNSFRIVAIDKSTMQSSFTNRDIPVSQLALVHFLAISNQLETPKLLHCPADYPSIEAVSFTDGFSNSNISYFVSLDASEDQPQMILSGDDNLAVNGAPVQSGVLNIPTNATAAWTNERHRKCGNIGLADGSAQQVTSDGLQTALQNALNGVTNTVNRFAIP